MSNQACSVFSLVCYANHLVSAPFFNGDIPVTFQPVQEAPVNSHKHVAHGPLSSPDAIVKVLKALQFFIPDHGDDVIGGHGLILVEFNKKCAFCAGKGISMVKLVKTK